MPRSKHTILALDPGLKDLGFAVVSGRRIVTVGVFALRLVPKEERLKEAQVRIAALFAAHHPDAIVVEKTYRHPLPWLNELHGISRYGRRLARRFGVQFGAYSPQAVRATVAGNGKAKKPEVALAVVHLFPQLRVYLTQDRKWKEKFWLNMFDAMALAVHYQSLTQPPSRSR